MNAIQLLLDNRHNTHTETVIHRSLEIRIPRTKTEFLKKEALFPRYKKHTHKKMKSARLHIIEYFDSLINQVDLLYELKEQEQTKNDSSSSSAVASLSLGDGDQRTLCALATTNGHTPAEPSRNDRHGGGGSSSSSNGCGVTAEYMLGVRTRCVNELRRMQTERLEHYKQNVASVERELARLKAAAAAVAVESSSSEELELLRRVIFADRFAFLLPIKTPQRKQWPHWPVVLVKTDFYMSDDGVAKLAKLFMRSFDDKLPEEMCQVFNEVGIHVFFWLTFLVF